MFIAAFSHPLICLPQIFWLIWGFPWKLLSLLPVFLHNPCCVVVVTHTHAPAPMLCGELQETRNAPCHHLCWRAICQALLHNGQLWIRALGLKYKEEKHIFFHRHEGIYVFSKSHTWQNHVQLKVTHIKKPHIKPLWYLPTHTAMEIYKKRN